MKFFGLNIEKPEDPVKNEDYEDLKILYKEWESLHGTRSEYSDLLNVCTSFLKVFDACDQKALRKMVRRDAIEKHSRLVHPVFGPVDHYGDLFKKLVNPIRADREEARTAVEQSDLFRVLQKTLPHPEVQVPAGTDAAPLPLSSFKEVEFAKIQRNFDRDAKLACFVSISVITSSQYVDQGRITRLAAVRFDDFVPAEAFAVSLDTPGADPIDERERVMPYHEGIRAFLAFIGDRPVCGFYTGLAMKFLHCAGYPLATTASIYDLAQLATKAYTKKELPEMDFIRLCSLDLLYFPKAMTPCDEALACGLILNEVTGRITGTYRNDFTGLKRPAPKKLK